MTPDQLVAATLACFFALVGVVIFLLRSRRQRRDETMRRIVRRLAKERSE